MATIKDSQPWYKQFWPCFLLTILSVSIIGSITMLFVAIGTSDGLVKDDYYKEGLAINRELAHDKMASALGLQAELRVSDDKNISLILFHQKDMALPKQITLDFIFPTRANRDQSITLSLNNKNTYIGTSQKPLRGHWYMQLTPSDTRWRLTGELQLPQQSLTLLSPHL